MEVQLIMDCKIHLKVNMDDGVNIAELGELLEKGAFAGTTIKKLSATDEDGNDIFDKKEIKNFKKVILEILKA